MCEPPLRRCAHNAVVVQLNAVADCTLRLASCALNMPRLRRYLPPIVILAPVVLICCRLLLTYVPRVSDNSRVVGDRGWPLAFQTRSLSLISSVGSPPTIAWKNDAISWPQLSLDIAVQFAVVLAAAALLALHYRHHGRWLRFSLRGLLIFTTIVCVALGWFINLCHEASSQEQLLWHLSRDNFTVRQQRDYCGPQWLLRLAPEWSWLKFSAAVELQASDTRPSEDCARELQLALPNLPHVRSLVLHARLATYLTDPAAVSRIERVYLFVEDTSNASDEGLAAVSRWPHLQSLTLGNTSVSPDPLSDRGLAALGTSTTLQQLSIPEGTLPKITDAGLVGLSRAPRIESLILPETNISDAGIESLAVMPALESLTLRRSPNLTDAGICALAKSKSLRSVTLPGPPDISDAALEFLANHIENVSAFQPGGLPKRYTAR
jgi:hypothetical protein